MNLHHPPIETSTSSTSISPLSSASSTALSPSSFYYTVKWYGGDLGLALTMLPDQTQVIINRITGKGNPDGIQYAQPGDFIISINQENMKGKTLDQVVLQLQICDLPACLRFKHKSSTSTDQENQENNEETMITETENEDRSENQYDEMEDKDSSSCSFDTRDTYTSDITSPASSPRKLRYTSFAKKNLGLNRRNNPGERRASFQTLHDVQTRHVRIRSSSGATRPSTRCTLLAIEESNDNNDDYPLLQHRYSAPLERHKEPMTESNNNMECETTTGETESNNNEIDNQPMESVMLDMDQRHTIHEMENQHLESETENQCKENEMENQHQENEEYSPGESSNSAMESMEFHSENLGNDDSDVVDTTKANRDDNESMEEQFNQMQLQNSSKEKDSYSTTSSRPSNPFVNTSAVTQRSVNSTRSSSARNVLQGLHLAAAKGNVEEFVKAFRLYSKEDNKSQSKTAEELDMSLRSSFNPTPVDNETPLHIAVRCNRVEIVTIICRYCTFVEDIINVQDVRGDTPLHHSVRVRATMVYLLLEQNADGRIYNCKGLSPLTEAILSSKRDDSKIIQLLLRKGSVNPNDTYKGQTALHLALNRRLYNVAASLIYYGSSMNLEDTDGCNAFEKTDRKILRTLIAHINYPPTFITLKDRAHCMLCRNKFGIAKRPKNCTHCGRICCKECASFTAPYYQFPSGFPGRLRGGGTAVREKKTVCKTCYHILRKRYDDEDKKKSSNVLSILREEWVEVNPHKIRSYKEITL